MNNIQIQCKKQDFLKFKWSAWKLLDCWILHQIPQSFWGPWTALRPPAVIAQRGVRLALRLRVTVTPLWKFLSTGLLYNISTMRKFNITIFTVSATMFYHKCYYVIQWPLNKCYYFLPWLSVQKLMMDNYTIVSSTIYNGLLTCKI
jgi:hypothetical protein